MSEQLQEFKIQKMREFADKLADAVAEHTFLEHYRKVLLAGLMKKYMVQSSGNALSVNAQEREALPDPEYTEFLKKLKEAEKEKVFWQSQWTVFKTDFEVWKTKSINQTVEMKAYGT